MTQDICRKYLKIVSLSVAGLLAVQATCAKSIALDPAAALRASYAELRDHLESSPIQQGLHVESVDNALTPRGDAYAVISYSFDTAASAFTSPAVLCESLILHINVQYCGAAGSEESPVLSLALGKKKPQRLEDTHRIDLRFHVVKDADYLRIALTAREGPLGTSDYLIAMELVALDEDRAFMHIRYAYKQSVLARIATGMYFSTSGREKVGFTVLANAAGGAPQLVRGIRGVLERNTMRYYLAFDAYLHALEAAEPDRFEASLERWFDQTERFSRQLREVDRDDYIAMKRSQYERQLAAM